MDDQYRADAKALLEPRGVECFDPILARDYRGKEIANEAVIVEGDLADVNASDIVLGNYSIPGWGTGMESWHAYLQGKPIIAYVAIDARVSPWVAYIAGGYDNVHRDLASACAAIA
jgi:nucleoside 2-deoxyribosyltransferase